MAIPADNGSPDRGCHPPRQAGSARSRSARSGKQICFWCFRSPKDSIPALAGQFCFGACGVLALLTRGCLSTRFGTSVRVAVFCFGCAGYRNGGSRLRRYIHKSSRFLAIGHLLVADPTGGRAHRFPKIDHIAGFGAGARYDSRVFRGSFGCGSFNAMRCTLGILTSLGTHPTCESQQG